jgi:CHASE2 domain-containing sensor protein
MISLKDVLQYSDSQLYGLFAWKYVLIGDSQKVNGDSVESPVTGGDMIWVELHAHFLEGLLQNKMLKK